MPPVFIAAIGTPSAAASISTRLSDSGPYDGNASSVACRIQAQTSSRFAPPEHPQVEAAALGLRLESGAHRSVADDDQRQASAARSSAGSEELHALVVASLPA